jgi:hypothetical protein
MFCGSKETCFAPPKKTEYPVQIVQTALTTLATVIGQRNVGNLLGGQ